jgi:hypothetical protein
MEHYSSTADGLEVTRSNSCGSSFLPNAMIRVDQAVELLVNSKSGNAAAPASELDAKSNATSTKDQAADNHKKTILAGFLLY